MATLYAMYGAPEGRTYSQVQNRSTPGAIYEILDNSGFYACSHQPGDRIEIINTGNVMVDPQYFPYNRLRAGLGPDARTTVAAADHGAFGKPRLQRTAGDLPIFWPTQPYLRLENLDLAHLNSWDKSHTGEAVVTTDSSIAAQNIDIFGCRIGGTNNTGIQSKYGPTPSDGTSAGTPGLDDANWRLWGCEIYDCNVHGIICHGSGWDIGPWLDDIGVLHRGSIHKWGNSTVVTGSQKHAIYNHSRGIHIHGIDCFNSEADRPWQGSISQRASGMQVYDCNFNDMIPLSCFWYDNIKGNTRIHDNRAWNCYDYFWFFNGQSDPSFSPPYVWHPNPVDSFLFYKNTVHLKGYQDATTALSEAAAFIDCSDPTAAFTAGVEVTGNVFRGNARRGVDFGSRAQRFSANNGFTGKYRGKKNAWKRTAGAILFREAGTEYTLAAWQAR